MTTRRLKERLTLLFLIVGWLAAVGTFITISLYEGRENPIVDDMRKAAQSISNGSKQGYDPAVDRAVEKYFYPMMAHDDALALLKQLHENGFHVVEYLYNGERIWPDGALNLYPKERKKQPFAPKGEIRYVAVKQIGSSSFLVSSEAAIVLTFDEERGALTSVLGNIWHTGM